MNDNNSSQHRPRHRALAYPWLFALSLSLVGVPTEKVSADEVFVGAGDIAGFWTQDEATAKLLDNIVTQFPSAMVFTAGDNAYPNGAAAEFNTYYAPTWGRHKARTRPSPGNHDYNSSGAGPYYSYFGANAGPAGRGYYSYNLGPSWHIISLNSNVAAGAGSAQEQWLRTDLEAAITAPCTLAYWHHPRFSSGANHGNDARTDALFRALYEYGTDVVVTGHDHIYERFAPQDPNAQADPTGIREFVVGTGGAGLYGIGTIRANSEVRGGAPNGAHGVLKLTLKEGNYDWEFISIAGQTFRDTGNAAFRAGGWTLYAFGIESDDDLPPALDGGSPVNEAVVVGSRREVSEGDGSFARGDAGGCPQAG
jgi:acid phosphatase type 7